MAWFLGQSLAIIVGSILLGVLIGWLLWGRARRLAPATAAAGTSVALAPPAPVAAPEETVEPAETPEPVVAAEPVETPEPVVDAEQPDAAEPVETPEPLEGTEPVEAVEPVAVIEPVAPADTIKPAVVIEPAAPTGTSEPAGAAEDQPDDELERIEGIGPKMAAALRAAGIRSFARLAGSDEAVLRTAIEDAGLSFAPSLGTWSRQARLLADGDEEGFADLARRLVAGRDVGRS